MATGSLRQTVLLDDSMTAKSNTSEDTMIPRPLAVDIKELILTIRGIQVLLDSDVAMLYGYETKAINQAASRNKKRFPPEFRFQLTAEEINGLSRSQIVTLNNGRGSNIKYRPFVYSEMGIGMLSGILKNDTAVQVSVRIMKAFVEMRRLLAANRFLYEQISDINNKLSIFDSRLQEQDTRVNNIIALLSEPQTDRQWLFFKGQFYDAFKLVIDFIKRAKTNITIIDSYVDESVLEMLSNKEDSVAVTIITAHPSRLSWQHLNRFAAQYDEVRVVASREFHDRFVVLDENEVYAFGASLKDLGNKCFEVSKIEDTAEFIARVSKIISNAPL